MEQHTLFTRLCLDSTGTDGATSEVSQPVALPPGANAIQWAATHFVLTATDVSYQLMASNDMENWVNKGSAQTHTAVGHKLFTTDTSVAAAYVRVKATITGTGKAIVALELKDSQQ